MQRFAIRTRSATDKTQTVTGEGFRISVLASRMFRVETGNFCDEATQSVWYRDFERPHFKVLRQGNLISVKTEEAELIFDTSKKQVKEIVLADGRHVRNFRKGNLFGTRRTLDMVSGKAKLEDGLVSRGGVAVFDDSSSLILKEDKIIERPQCKDTYYFAYGNKYRDCISDFYKLCGQTPLIPKFALGNWWSRYKAYTQQEYRDLMQTFVDKKIPVTVATIDMDWHWVDVVKKFGNKAKELPPDTVMDSRYTGFNPGWTGYSWNTDLFPDYKKLLSWLNDNGFTVTLNLHPAQGVRFFEDSYADVCKVVGKDPANGEGVAFSLASDKFLQAYFDVIHRPYQNEGVRFWWIDWQQGKKSDVKGLDPLWALNHYHTLDQQDEGKRALILSRYAGVGSHRYPLGFSGDSSMNWQTLDFQPYMTATATNVGYTWWSHDIGGHHMGYKDDELYIRWLQLGVFSPINRLHSTSNEFMGKEPWKCSKSTENIAEYYLRLRHRMIPYLYSVNYLTHTEGRALCEPMYYSYDCKQAYEAKNQYSFGTQLVVAPITQKSDRRSQLASTKLWVPQGETYTDIFTGRIYKSGEYEICRDLQDFPVFAKKGSIIPMYADCEDNGLSVNKALEVWIYRGNGGFTLYDDDGETLDYISGKQCFTDMKVSENEDRIEFTLSSRGDLSLFEGARKISLVFRDIISANATVNGKDVSFSDGRVELTFDGKQTTVVLNNCRFAQNRTYREEVIDAVSRFQMSNIKKKAMFSGYLDGKKKPSAMMSKRYAKVLEEIASICEN